MLQRLNNRICDFWPVSQQPKVEAEKQDEAHELRKELANIGPFQGQCAARPDQGNRTQGPEKPGRGIHDDRFPARCLASEFRHHLVKHALVGQLGRGTR